MSKRSNSTSVCPVFMEEGSQVTQNCVTQSVRIYLRLTSTLDNLTLNFCIYLVK